MSIVQLHGNCNPFSPPRNILHTCINFDSPIIYIITVTEVFCRFTKHNRIIPQNSHDQNIELNNRTALVERSFNLGILFYLSGHFDRQTEQREDKNHTVTTTLKPVDMCLPLRQGKERLNYTQGG